MDTFQQRFEIDTSRIKASISCHYPDGLDKSITSKLTKAQPGVKALLESAVIGAVDGISGEDSEPPPRIVDAIELKLELPGKGGMVMIRLFDIELKQPGAIVVDFYRELLSQLALRLARSIKEGRLIGLDVKEEEPMRRVEDFVTTNAPELGLTRADIASIISQFWFELNGEAPDSQQGFPDYPNSVSKFADAASKVTERDGDRAKVADAGIDPDGDHELVVPGGHDDYVTTNS